MLLPSKLSLIIGAALIAALAALGLMINKNGALQAERDSIAEQARRSVSAAAAAANDWQALYHAEIAAREQAQAVAEQRARDRLQAVRAAAQSAAELEKYLRSVRDDPTACVNQRIPDAVAKRLRDAAGPGSSREAGSD